MTMQLGSYWHAIRHARELRALHNEAVLIREEAQELRDDAVILVENSEREREICEQTIFELSVAALQSQRASLAIAVATRLALDDPDIDIRSDLDQLIEDLTNAVACLEEQVVT